MGDMSLVFICTVVGQRNSAVAGRLVIAEAMAIESVKKCMIETSIQQ